MKKMKVCMCILALAVGVAACIGCYYWYVEMHPNTKQGGILVYEHHAVHSNEQKC